MPSATLIEFNQEIIQNRQSRGIAVKILKGKQELKFFNRKKMFLLNMYENG